MFARATIFLLLALNLGVALWTLLRDDAAGNAPEPEATTAPGIVPLQLASEVDGNAVVAQDHDVQEAEPVGRELAAEGEPEATADAVTADATATPADAMLPAAVAPATSAAVSDDRCFALGVFGDAAAAAAARGQLPRSVTGVRVRKEPGASNGWRVSMAPQADRAAAEAMAGRLREAGFTDLFVVASGEEVNAIALGRFGSEAAARRHAAALDAAGFGVRVDAVSSPARYWLDVVMSGTGADAGVLRRATGAARVDGLDCARLR